MKVTKKEKQDAIDNLKNLLIDESGNLRKVFMSIREVSRSGMSRKIRAWVVIGETHYKVDWYFSQVCGYSYDSDKSAVKVTGCGMDMGLALWESVIYRVFPDKDFMSPNSVNFYQRKFAWLD